MKTTTIDDDGVRYELTKADCKALLSCAFKGGDRPPINTVLFDAQNLSAVASDGHTLMIARYRGTCVTQVSAPSFQLSRADFAEMVSLLRANQTLTVESDGTNATCHILAQPLGASVCRFSKRQPDTKFPPYADVIPDLDPTDGENIASVAFNPTYIARVLLMSKAAGVPTATWQLPRDASSPIVATSTNHQTRNHWVCVIMPVRQ